MSVPPTGSDKDSVSAKWLDGTWWVIEGETVETLRPKILGSSSSNKPALWDGINCETRHDLKLVQRADRHLLLSLVEQSKQILQFRVDKHGELPPDTAGRTIENDHPTILQP